jgi:hypothetical protein
LRPDLAHISGDLELIETDAIHSAGNALLITAAGVLAHD